MIDAMEGQEVATSDIPGAFLQTDYDTGDIHIKLEGAMVTLLEYIDPEYYKYLIFTNKPLLLLSNQHHQPTSSPTISS